MNSQRNMKESEKRPTESAVETYRTGLPLPRYFLEGKGYSDLENTWEPEEQSAKKKKNPESTIRKRNLSKESTADDAPARKKNENKHLNLSSEKQDFTLKSAKKTSSALSTSAARGCSVFVAHKTEARNTTFTSLNFKSDLPYLDSNLPVYKESGSKRTELLKQIELLRKEVPEAEESLETIKSHLISLEADTTPLINDLNAIAGDAKDCIVNVLNEFKIKVKE